MGGKLGLLLLLLVLGDRLKSHMEELLEGIH